MAMTILHNLSAQLTLGELNKNTNQAGKLLSRVSSGQKITGAKDDASAYAISEKMRVRLRSLSQDSQNVQNGSSMLRIAEGGISNIVDELRSLKELAINAATDTNTDEDRHILQKTFEQKMANINDIATTTSYNGKRLLDGTYARPAIVTRTITETITTAARNSPITSSANLIANYTSVLREVENPTADDTIEIAADSGDYTIDEDGVYSIASGYSGTVTVNAQNVRLVQAEPSTTLNGVQILSAESGEANLWIENLNITNNEGSIIKFRGDDNVLTLLGNNVLIVEDAQSAAINMGTGNSLNVQGADFARLTVRTSSSGAGIGSDMSEKLSGNLNIVNLTASINAYDGAGIGSGGSGGAVGDVNVENSNLEFTGSVNSAIGSGSNGSSVANISVVSSRVTNANSIDTCIGSGFYNSSCGDIMIVNSYVESHNRDSPAIGSGDDGSVCGNIYVSNSTINTESTYGAGVGTGSRAGAERTSNAQTIVISNNSSIAHVSKDGAAVGTGLNGHVDGILISTSSKINAASAYRSLEQVPPNSGIGPGRNGDVSSIGDFARFDDNDAKSSTVTRTIIVDATPKFIPLVIHTGTLSNQSVNVIINDMHTKSLKGQIPNEADAEHLNTLSNDEDKFNAYQAILDKAKDMTLDDASLATRADANVAIRVIEGAIDYALDEATTLGAYLNRLEHTASNITIMGENVQAAESAIRDADMAKEMTNYTKANVLTQAAQSMLAQANQNSSAVLSLIQ